MQRIRCFIGLMGLLAVLGVIPSLAQDTVASEAVEEASASPYTRVSSGLSGPAAHAVLPGRPTLLLFRHEQRLLPNDLDGLAASVHLGGCPIRPSALRDLEGPAQIEASTPLWIRLRVYRC